MPDILITGQEAAANTNLLANSRLETIPAGSRALHFRCQADLSNATNAMSLTIELPSGMIPVDGQQVADLNGTATIFSWLAQLT